MGTRVIFAYSGFSNSMYANSSSSPGPGSITSSVLSTNDLKPDSRSLVNWITPECPPLRTASYLEAAFSALSSSSKDTAPGMTLPAITRDGVLSTPRRS